MESGRNRCGCRKISVACEKTQWASAIGGGCSLPVAWEVRNTPRPARPHRLSVRTPAFQAGEAGSIPAGDATLCRCAGRTPRSVSACPRVLTATHFLLLGVREYAFLVVRSAGDESTALAASWSVDVGLAAQRGQKEGAGVDSRDLILPAMRSRKAARVGRSAMASAQPGIEPSRRTRSIA